MACAGPAGLFPGKSRPTLRAWFVTRISEVGSLQTKLHHVPLELVHLRPEARPPPVRGPHPLLMIAAGQIELSEEAKPPRAVEQRVDVRQRLDWRSCEAAWPAVECWIQPRSSRSMSCVRSSASSPSDKRFTGRDRDILRVTCLELQLHTAVRRHARWGPAQHIGVFDLERRECRVVGGDEAELRVRQTERRQAELRAVLDQHYAVGELTFATIMRVVKPGRGYSLVCIHHCDSSLS